MMSFLKKKKKREGGRKKKKKGFDYQSFCLLFPSQKPSDHHTPQIFVSGYLARISVLQCALAFDVLHLNPPPCLVHISRSSSSE